MGPVAQQQLVARGALEVMFLARLRSRRARLLVCTLVVVAQQARATRLVVVVVVVLIQASIVAQPRSRLQLVVAVVAVAAEWGVANNVHEQFDRAVPDLWRGHAVWMAVGAPYPGFP